MYGLEFLQGLDLQAMDHDVQQHLRSHPPTFGITQVQITEQVTHLDQLAQALQQHHVAMIELQQYLKPSSDT